MMALREVQLAGMAPEGPNQNTVQVQFETLRVSSSQVCFAVEAFPLA